MVLDKTIPPREVKLKFFSPDGKYKTTVKKRYSLPEKVKETRTIKGIITGASKPKKVKTPKILMNEGEDLALNSNNIKNMKSGGSTPAWTRKAGKDPKGGLNAKGVASYRAANPGSKLKTAVTTKPSKLKAGSKDANRRKSFCARMSGVKGPAKKPNGEPTRKTLALRKWNC